MFTSRWRRVLGAAAVLGLLLLTACSTTHGRAQTKVLRVGFLGFGNPVASAHILTAAQQELGARGYVEGQNLHIEWRWANGDTNAMPALAAELVKLKPDLLFAGSDPPALALQQATSTIPIAFLLCGDPVGQGFAASLAHPGGNMTGYTESCYGSLLDEKRLEFLRTILPDAKRLVVLWYPSTTDIDAELAAVVQTAQTLGFTPQALKVLKPEDLPDAFNAATAAGAEALLMLPSNFMTTNRAQIFDLALKHRLPSMGGPRQYTDAGALLSYGSNLDSGWRHAWAYVDRIHKGARPADLPVEQPTIFDLVVNLKTAQALGITIPDSVLTQATDVIR